MDNWIDRLLAPVGALFNRKAANAERKTTEYLYNVNPTSCLIDLSKALKPLLGGVDHVDKVFAQFSTTNSNGKRFWGRDHFERYIDARLPGDDTVLASMPLLWRIFVSSAFYPFSAPSAASGEAEIDLDAFRRAFALLVMRGFELFGAKKNGRPLLRSLETSYPEKVPRLSRNIFRCLSQSSPDSALQTEAAQEARLRDIKDTIEYTQPITYEPLPYGLKVNSEQFEVATSRLARMEDDRSTIRGPSQILSKTDLGKLIQLLLLLSPQGRRWRDGLFIRETYQRSGDIQCAQLASSLEETSLSPDLALPFVASQLVDSEGSVSWDAFETWCSDCPSFLFLFFQLWASIFVPTNIKSSGSQSESSLRTTTANLLCLLNIANFKSGTEAKYRFHDNELQLQQDLQASTLVADLAAKPELDEMELHQTIMARDRLHVLLMVGEDLEANGGTGNNRRLFAVFLGPSEKEMWRREEGRWVMYVWRSSVVQLQPTIAIANNGTMSANVVSGLLELRSYSAVAEELSPSINLDMQKKLVDVVGLATKPENSNDLTEKATLRMRLTDLKCYRLPGEVSTITYNP